MNFLRHRHAYVRVTVPERTYTALKDSRWTLGGWLNGWAAESPDRRQDNKLSFYCQRALPTFIHQSPKYALSKIAVLNDETRLRGEDEKTQQNRAINIRMKNTWNAKLHFGALLLLFLFAILVLVISYIRIYLLLKTPQSDFDNPDSATTFCPPAGLVPTLCVYVYTYAYVPVPSYYTARWSSFFLRFFCWLWQRCKNSSWRGWRSGSISIEIVDRAKGIYAFTTQVGRSALEWYQLAWQLPYSPVCPSVCPSRKKLWGRTYVNAICFFPWGGKQ